MAAKWLYQHGDKVFGPVSTRELLAAAHLGFLRPADLVRRSDRTTWRAAGSIEGLFVASREQPTPHTQP